MHSVNDSPSYIVILFLVSILRHILRDNKQQNNILNEYFMLVCIVKIKSEEEI